MLGDTNPEFSVEPNAKTVDFLKGWPRRRVA